MPDITLQTISIYPIKSSSGIQLSSSWVEELGLAFDRRFVVASPTGEMFTARTEPRLCLIQSNLTANGINITAPGMPALLIEYAKLSDEYQQVTVWDSTIHSQKGAEQYNQWFTRYLGKPAQLLFFGENSERFVKNKNSQVGFADGYPLLLISQQSLADLNQKLSASNVVSMTQFRPNIVVDGCASFDEDTWKHIRIGEVEFEITTPCSRCIFTTINPETAEQHSQQEPLKTLMNYRQVESGDVMFGQNLVPLNQGQIKMGDKVEVLETKHPPVFIQRKKNNKSASHTVETNAAQTSAVQASAEATKKPKINFSSWNKEITGNNKKSLLEQGEDAGLLLPYSCRAGMCGRCKIKLESGDVEQTSTDGLSEKDKEQGYVLACCSIPKSNVVLSKPSRPQR